MRNVWHDQSAYDIRLEWGAPGLAALAGGCDVLVIIDVLSFSTCVDVALGRGASVYPFAEPGDAARAFATKVGAVCAGPRSAERYSLSPRSLMQLNTGERIVLPSPNGASLSLRTGDTPTFAACLRNAAAVAREVSHLARRIGVIAAGERWPSGELRFAIEDWLGAGAVIAALDGHPSPEAEAARLSYEAAAPRIEATLLESVSGRELVERGFAEDVAIAAELNVSRCVPRLHEGAFVDFRRTAGDSNAAS
jgi:2-phosphosulfolactate phosphatase